MTITLENTPKFAVPAALVRHAGFKQGDRLEIKVARNSITIVRKLKQATNRPAT